MPVDARCGTVYDWREHDAPFLSRSDDGLDIFRLQNQCYEHRSLEFVHIAA
jgi:hypothetical protein